jgi:hypothetical protein
VKVPVVILEPDSTCDVAYAMQSAGAGAPTEQQFW